MERKKMKIDARKGEARIVFNGDFYPRGFVSLAAKDFKGVCSFRRNGLELILKSRSKAIDIRKTGYEFCNYVLSLIKSKGAF